MSMRMASLELIDRLCGCFESQLSGDGDEAAAEMMRVIRAVAEDGKVVLEADGHLASVLSSSFGGDAELWRHVELKKPESID